VLSLVCCRLGDGVCRNGPRLANRIDEKEELLIPTNLWEKMRSA